MRMLSACFAGRAIYSLAFPLAVIPILSPLASARATAQAVQLSTMRQNVLFPSTTVGANSSSITVPLVVNADGIIISAISVGTSAGGKQEFTIQSIGCALNTTLPKGTACNVRVAFSPRYPGNRSAPLQLETSSGNFYFGMEGIGVGPQAALNPATINTVAGNGSSTLSGDGGPAINAGVPVPLGTAIDSAGNLFIVDAADGIIREVATVSGIISTVPFSLPYNLNDPTAVVIDSAGNLYIADTENGFIRKVSPATGDASTFVGTGHYVGKPPSPPQGYAGDGGPATAAELNVPQGVAFDRTDDLYIGDTGNNVIRRVDAVTGIITTVAGNLKAGSGYSGDGGPAINAELNNPIGVAVDTAGNLYIADLGNNVVRKYPPPAGSLPRSRVTARPDTAATAARQPLRSCIPRPMSQWMVPVISTSLMATTAASAKWRQTPELLQLSPALRREVLPGRAIALRMRNSTIPMASPSTVLAIYISRIP